MDGHDLRAWMAKYKWRLYYRQHLLPRRYATLHYLLKELPEETKDWMVLTPSGIKVSPEVLTA